MDLKPLLDEIEQIIPPGYCRGCLGCCRFNQVHGPWVPHLLESEQKLLGDLRIVPCEGNEISRFKCSCLDQVSNTCTVYASRPLECRLYPFVLRRGEKGLFLSVDPHCPFVAEKAGNGLAVSYGKRLAELLQTADWRDTLRRNPHLFQPYQDVEDIAELSL